MSGKTEFELPSEKEAPLIGTAIRTSRTWKKYREQHWGKGPAEQITEQQTMVNKLLQAVRSNSHGMV